MPTEKEALADDLRICPRCGGQHKGLIFSKFTRPAFMGGIGYRYWALCPHTHEPLFFRMIAPQEARAMRTRIGACGLDFRDVYREVGIECETDTTPGQLEEVNRIIKARGGPTETPITAVDVAADRAMRTIESSLVACGAGVRHMLVLIDAVDVPDGEGNATLAGFGYDDPRDLLAELLTHAEEVGAKLGIAVNVIVPQARNQG